MKRSSKKGFTLAELLIVIAIIAVLIAIMVPVFGAQIDKARAAAELANVRAKYSELVAAAMLGDGNSLTADPANTVTISFKDLQAAEQYDDKTFITIDTTKPSSAQSADSTKMPDKAADTAYTTLYVTVSYKGYFGSFEIDTDVVIDNFS